jgi:hypothetical protein
MFNPELLRSFVSVVDSGQFHARRRAGPSHPVDRHQQIKRLEDDVGQPLLNRNGKDVTPTEAGERLLSSHAQWNPGPTASGSFAAGSAETACPQMSALHQYRP